MKSNLMRLSAVFTAVLLAAALTPTVGRADAAVVGARGSGVVPLQNADVEMVAERVDIYPYSGWVYVEAEFTLHNTGPTTELLVGFPEEEYQDEDSRGGLRRLAIKDFTAEVDGASVPVTYRTATPSSEPVRSGELGIVGWHTFGLPFAADQTRVVRNTYFLRPTWHSNFVLGFHYLLQTGAVWKGDIREADIVVHSSGGYIAARMKAWRGSEQSTWSSGGRLDHMIEGDTLAWHLHDLEPGPEDDIWLSADLSAASDAALWITAEGSEVTPGDSVSFTATNYSHTQESAESQIVLCGGKEGRRLAELAVPPDSMQVSGQLKFPSGLSPVHGGAVEIWAEYQPSGVRSTSALVFVKDRADKLPSTGDPSAAFFTATVLVGACLVGGGVAVGTMSRRAHPERTASRLDSVPAR